jgi:hypothetical protein
LFLAAPIVLAVIVNRGRYLPAGLVLCAVVLGWMVWSVRHLFPSQHRNVGRSVSGLLAGICLVDMLAVAPENPLLALAFLPLFGLCLLFQRFIPAT